VRYEKYSKTDGHQKVTKTDENQQNAQLTAVAHFSSFMFHINRCVIIITSMIWFLKFDKNVKKLYYLPKTRKKVTSLLS
jgi:hypothetical protein